MACNSSNDKLTEHKECVSSPASDSNGVCSNCKNRLISGESKLCSHCCQGRRPTSSIDLRMDSNLQVFAKSNSKLDLPSRRRSPRPPSSAQYRLKPTITTSQDRLSQFIKDSNATSNDLLNNCETINRQISRLLQSNNEVKKKINVSLKKREDILLELQEIEQRNEAKLKYIDEINKKLRVNLQKVNGKEKQLRTVKSQLGTASNFQDAAPAFDESERLHKYVWNYLEELDASLAKDDQMLQGLHQNAHDITIKFGQIQEILDSPEEGCKEINIYETLTEDEELDLTDDIDFQTVQERTPTHVTVEDLRSMTELAKSTIIQGNLFVVTTNKGGKIYASLSLADNNDLLLNHFQKRIQLPSTAQTLQYSDVMSVADSHSTTKSVAFLELANIRSTIGTVALDIEANTTRGQQFLVLCTGKMGYSYANTKFLQVGNKGHKKLEFIRGGDFENNDGTGGKPLLPKILEEDKDAYSRQCMAGTIGGVAKEDNKIGSQFVIRTKDNVTRCCSPSFGKVETGLSILNKVISEYRNIKDVSIKECGLVLWHWNENNGDIPVSCRADLRMQSQRDIPSYISVCPSNEHYISNQREVSLLNTSFPAEGVSPKKNPNASSRNKCTTQ